MVAATAALTLTASLAEPSYALTPKQRRELDDKTEAMYEKVEPRRPQPDRFRGTELRAPAKKTTSPAAARAAKDNKRRPAAKTAKKTTPTNKTTARTNKKTAAPVKTTKKVAPKAPGKKKVSRFNSSLAVGVLLGVGLWGYTTRNPSEPSVSNLANKAVTKKSSAAPAAAPAAAPTAAPAATTSSSTTMATKKSPAENAKEAQEWIDAWTATAPERRAASAQAWIDAWKKSQNKGFFSW